MYIRILLLLRGAYWLGLSYQFLVSSGQRIRVETCMQ